MSTSCYQQSLYADSPTDFGESDGTRNYVNVSCNAKARTGITLGIQYLSKHDKNATNLEKIGLFSV